MFWENPQRVKKSLDEHKEIMFALERMDLKKFQVVMKNHLEAWKKDYQNYFALRRKG